MARAVLFAASDQAVRAYRALGFRQIGRFGLFLFDGTRTVPALDPAAAWRQTGTCKEEET
ncbi:GNAT family protein [Mangrovicoccus ximenensis]|uniref:hypothetical protein n=1 Tax=Mangrovicoccus ximenensis TaxID=1911570 RepID=UPI000D377DA6|nr:hypothetical protein [Mangrovicoccus ximenensis]